MRFGRVPEVSPLVFAGCSGGGDEFSPSRIRQTLPDMEGTSSAVFANSAKAAENDGSGRRAVRTARDGARKRRNKFE